MIGAGKPGVDEAEIEGPVSGTAVMVRQLDRLIEAGALPTVSVRVLLFSAGLHRGIMSGPFEILRFPTTRPSQTSGSRPWTSQPPSN